ncbi:6-phosphofructokinase [Methanospirillum sp. J.3.6.1-F.2.7.3]|uniref:6-phosphofructokinase n=1 Tax=Methanospirillum purgamenti TaxID=2834276 RepID=A0A8E7AUX3_9EURY|nr:MULTISPECIES: 6-phosphofructokinase [Methanospirillum]MDX8550358.1 6-phosphofructokinase [Methanospirillum hungatei]QVV87982.1 6-phosphofructokinase [Methanospirillum sp. J.3.6.1-F.2.7.3]
MDGRAPGKSRIGILTSGGDAPGMNAAIRAVFRAASECNIEIVGIRRGFAGLIDGNLFLMDRSHVANIIHQGGTILGTSRSETFKTPEGRRIAADVLQNAEVDALFVIGGDGSFRGADLFNDETGIPTIGIPGSIDNDIPGTDFSIGFDTAINTALESIDKIRDTASSHGRLFFVEVMGKSSDLIAIESGIAGGAEYLILPDNKHAMDDLCSRLTQAFDAGKRYAIVVVAEGACPGCSFQIAKEVSSRISMESRVCVLGHTQRGGSPTARDRVLAAKLGVSAVNAYMKGYAGVMVGEVRRSVILTPFDKVITGRQKPEPNIIRLSHILTK